MMIAPCAKMLQSFERGSIKKNKQCCPKTIFFHEHKFRMMDLIIPHNFLLVFFLSSCVCPSSLSYHKTSISIDRNERCHKLSLGPIFDLAKYKT